MRTFRRQNFRSFFAGLTILSVTFNLYGCLVFGWRSCLQTMNTATSPNRANAATGINAARSFITLTPFSSYSSGVNRVPTKANTTMAIPVPTSNLALTRPVNKRPIRTMEITNSVLRPNMAAKYRRLESLSLTTQAYHTFSGRTTGK